MIDFAAYRAAYDAMSYEDLVGWHARVWALYPDQDKHSHDLLGRFFGKYGATNVVEVGGWTGDAAAAMLTTYPEIQSWRNYELCQQAIGAPATDDARYFGVWPEDWVWNLDAPEADTAVLAHVIEHMRAEQVGRLAGWISKAGVRRVYVEAPIWDEPRSWRRSKSFHILEAGWNQIIPMFSERGFTVTERHYYPPDRRVVIFGR